MTEFLSPIDRWFAEPRAVLREHVFEALQHATEMLADKGELIEDAREITIRLRAVFEAREDDLDDFAPIIETLTREVGLFPYVDTDRAHLLDLVARNAFRSTTEPEVIFHAEQQRIFHALEAGKSVVASAPTSFGKSLLIDSLLGLAHVRRSAIIVPTLALLDETRKRLLSKFGGDATIIFHRTQMSPDAGRVIFIGTQERLLDRDDIGDLDVLVVDEFYKADPARSDSRFIALNAAISRLSRLSRQFFLIGPFIDGIDKAGWRETNVEEVISYFKTVAVDSTYVPPEESSYGKVADIISEESNRPALIFVKSPRSAIELSGGLIKAGFSHPTQWSVQFADWLAENYTEEWELVYALRRGWAYHHGRLPRAIAATLVRAFNKGWIEVLICTSTLIEGVNTAAKAVLIWDKTLDRKPLDFFTFSNIRGRAGRMGRYYVGKVFQFHPAPAPETHTVEVPGLGGGGTVDEVLVHYDLDEVSDDVRIRLRNWRSATGLSREQLKRFSGLRFEKLVRLRENLEGLDDDGRLLLTWRNRPSYMQLKLLCDILWRSFYLSRSGAHGQSQLTFFIWRLFRSRTLTEFIKFFLTGPKQNNPDNIFGFMRYCEYSLPEMILATQESARANLNIECDYIWFATRLENWFLPENTKLLEEIGLPVIIFEKLGLHARPGTSVEGVVRQAWIAARRSRLSELELEMIAAASPNGLPPLRVVES